MRFFIFLWQHVTERQVLPLATSGAWSMDFDKLLRRSRSSLLADAPFLTPREKRAHDQFAREHDEQTRLTREALFGPAK